MYLILSFLRLCNSVVIYKRIQQILKQYSWLEVLVLLPTFTARWKKSFHLKTLELYNQIVLVSQQNLHPILYADGYDQKWLWLEVLSSLACIPLKLLLVYPDSGMAL